MNKKWFPPQQVPGRLAGAAQGQWEPREVGQQEDTSHTTNAVDFVRSTRAFAAFP